MSLDNAVARYNYRVWSADDGDRPDKPNATAWAPLTAAERFVGEHHADFDYAKVVEVLVEDAFGIVFAFVVTATQETSFSASAKEPVSVEALRVGLRRLLEVYALPVHASDGVAYVNRQSVVHALRKLERK